MAILRIPFAEDLPFVLVDCGARQASIDHNVLAAFPRMVVVGFEPDKDECDRLNRTVGNRHKYFPVAVGEHEGKRTLFVTRSPECSSLYPPNAGFLRKFYACSEDTKVIDTRDVETVSLDKYLPKIGINRIDFMKLDIQGAELEALRGSESFLQSSVLGLQLEVEFGQMYRNQPLFADLDSHIRRHQFGLFDLSRVRYRRTTLPVTVDSRGQLLWGDALYLRDHQYFLSRSMREEVVKLAVLASAYGFHDYALEVLQDLVEQDKIALTEPELEELERGKRSYLDELRPPRRLGALTTVLRLLPLRPIISRSLYLHGLMERRKPAWAD